MGHGPLAPKEIGFLTRRSGEVSTPRAARRMGQRPGHDDLRRGTTEIMKEIIGRGLGLSSVTFMPSRLSYPLAWRALRAPGAKSGMPGLVSCQITCYRVCRWLIDTRGSVRWGVEVEEGRSEPDPGELGTSSVNGHVSPASRTSFTPGESRGLSQEPADVNGGSFGGFSEPPDGLTKPADEPGGPSDEFSDSLDETDWETTRYLAAATQLDLRYARFVVSQIVGDK